jgi:hypothetical protein
MIFALLFSTLFVAIIVSVLRIIAYIRWTGKYPYSFLFNGSSTSADRGGKSSSGHSLMLNPVALIAPGAIPLLHCRDAFSATS